MLNDKYGVTKTGFVKKRLDEIEDEMHAALSEGWKIDTRSNKKSYLNTLITNFADKIAELWEVAEQTYQNLYPSTAEGEALDRVAQFGGSVREPATRSVYTILCDGENETTVPEGSIVETTGTPRIALYKPEDERISISRCVKAIFKVAGDVLLNTNYLINIGNMMAASVSYQDVTEETNPLSDMCTQINSFVESLDDADPRKVFRAKVPDASNPEDEKLIEEYGEKCLVVEFFDNDARKIEVSPTLNVMSVTSPLTFVTEGVGDIIIPETEVKNIKVGVPGLKSVSNLKEYVAGRNRETDYELRNAYSNKIFIRSRTMLESITSAILANCKGVLTLSAYQNDTNYYRGVPASDPIDKHMPPHSVEVVVDGGDTHEIAEQIFATKAAGIQTCHHCGNSLHILEDGEDYLTVPHSSECAVEKYALFIDPLTGQFKTTQTEQNERLVRDYCIEEPVLDDYGNEVIVRFSRPWEVYFSAEVIPTANAAEIPVYEAEAHIKAIIADQINRLAPGQDIQPQKWIHMLYDAVPGIANYDIRFKDLTLGTHVEDPDNGSPVSQNIRYNEIARIAEAAITINWDFGQQA